MASKEKRKFFRHPIHVPIQLSIEVASNKQKDWHSSEAVDLSLGGLSFFWKNKLPKGISLILSIPVNEKIFQNIHAKVTYSVEDKKSTRFRTGVRFMDIPSAFKAKLAEEALQILQYQKELSRELGETISEEEAATRWIKRFANQFPA